METEPFTVLNTCFEPTAIRNGYFVKDIDMVRNYGELKMNEVASNNVPYTIVPITIDDTEKVVHFLRKFFFRDEPLNVAIGLLDEPYSTCPELEEYCINCIPAGLSLAAVTPSGCFLGICLNGLMDRDKKEIDDKATREVIENCRNPKFKKILTLLTKLKDESNVFGYFPQVDRILDIVILSVDESCRGQGICKALIEKTKEVAQINDISVIKVDCSSYYSAKAVSRLGFHSIHTLSYAAHLDSEGRRIFQTEDPHNCAKTYVLSLTSTAQIGNSTS